MAKIKLTKNELKQQRDNLKRYRRYLPTLQLKKQQLQLEMRRCRELMDELELDKQDFIRELDRWIELFDDEAAGQVDNLLEVEEMHVGIRNIAGIDVPVFISLDFKDIACDMFRTPFWYDDIVAAVRRLAELSLKEELLQEQLELIGKELRVITQRVNLFEKVKIPEAEEAVRVIRIYLGDQQANAVGRAKIAKNKCRTRAASTALETAT